MYCSPSHNKQSSYTCYTKDELIRIAKYYNDQSHNNKSSQITKIKIKGRSKQQLWKDLYKTFGNRCNEEACWIEQDFVKTKDSTLRETFRPKRPKKWEQENYTTWLSNVDIDRIMEQYEQKYPNFVYLKTVPRDCEIDGAVSCPLKNFNIADAYKKGIRYVGSVVNLDTSDKPGSHWVAWFADMRKKNVATLEFYDSYASPIHREIMDTFDIFEKELATIGIKTKIDWNRVAKQRDNYSCGSYSVFFIVNRLNGKTLRQLEKMDLSTEKMQKFKLSIFRPSTHTN